MKRRVFLKGVGSAFVLAPLTYVMWKSKARACGNCRIDFDSDIIVAKGGICRNCGYNVVYDRFDYYALLHPENKMMNFVKEMPFPSLELMSLSEKPSFDVSTLVFRKIAQ